MYSIGKDFGTYVLLVRVSRRLCLRIGALGEHAFEAGWYVYTGSARRSLLQRVTRHLQKSKVARWHVDYLTSHPAARVVKVLLSTSGECETNKAICRIIAGEMPVKGFGASDCKAGCLAHLWRARRPITARDLKVLRGLDPSGAGKTLFVQWRPPVSSLSRSQSPDVR